MDNSINDKKYVSNNSLKQGELLLPCGIRRVTGEARNAGTPVLSLQVSKLMTNKMEE